MITILAEYIPTNNQISKDPKSLTHTSQPPPNCKRTKKVNPELAKFCKAQLIKAWGTIIEIEQDTKTYVLRVEGHSHYRNGKNGYHKGVTVYEPNN